MILKSSCLLLVLTVSQAFATSVNTLQLRALEGLESRQSVCPVCATVSRNISNCGLASTAVAIRCICSTTVNARVQACVDCQVANGIGDPAGLVDTYNKLCRSADAPTITNPAAAAAT